MASKLGRMCERSRTALHDRVRVCEITPNPIQSVNPSMVDLDVFYMVGSSAFPSEEAVDVEEVVEEGQAGDNSMKMV